MNKKLFIIIAVVVIVIIGASYMVLNQKPEVVVTNFEECVAAGNPVMESYPRQCRHEGATYVEDLGVIGEPTITQEEALRIAQDTKECPMTGILSDDISYNPNSKTWWIDLDRMPELEKDGCNPACVVSEQTKTAEVNWRCTGLKEPEVTACAPEQRNVDFCTMDYTPVCAKVNVQCVTTPCNPVSETFSNACEACKNPLVESYIAGECK